MAYNDPADTGIKHREQFQEKNGLLWKYSKEQGMALALPKARSCTSTTAVSATVLATGVVGQ